MKTEKAINIAIELIDKRIQVLAVDANLHDKMGADYPHAVNAAARRKELMEAREALKRLTFPKAKQSSFLE